MDRWIETDTDRQIDRHMITPQSTKWLIKSGATKPSPAWLVYEGRKTHCGIILSITQIDRQTDRQGASLQTSRGCCQDMVSHCPLEEKVFSIREQPINFACWLGSLAQSGRALAYKGESHGFESHRSTLFLPLSFHQTDRETDAQSHPDTCMSTLSAILPTKPKDTHNVTEQKLYIA